MYLYYNLKNLFSLSFLQAKNNFKGGENGSRLNVGWYLLDSLAFFVVLLYLFEYVLGVQSKVYPIYLLIGLAVFNFFRFSTVNAFVILGRNKGKINYVFTPEVFILSVLLQALFLHFFEFIFIGLVLLFYGMSLAGLFFYPIILFFLSLFVFGFSLILAVIGFFQLKLLKGWNVFVRTLWFVTPTFYFIESGSYIYTFNLFNPTFYFLHLTREIIIDLNIPSFLFSLVAIFFGLIFFLIGIIVYNKFRSRIIK